MLTGENRRWAHRSAVWKAGSLDLHAAHGDRPCQVCGSGEPTCMTVADGADVRRLRAEGKAAHRAGQAPADGRHPRMPCCPYHRQVCTEPPFPRSTCTQSCAPGTLVRGSARRTERMADRSPGGRARRFQPHRARRSGSTRRRTGSWAERFRPIAGGRAGPNQALRPWLGRHRQVDEPRSAWSRRPDLGPTGDGQRYRRVVLWLGRRP